MTPLAHKIIKELTLPIKRRTFVDHCGLLSMMDDIHCFDCSAVFEMAFELGRECSTASARVDAATFLPAPKTWIEWSRVETGERLRSGALVMQTYNPDGSPRDFIIYHAHEKWSRIGVCAEPMFIDVSKQQASNYLYGFSDAAPFMGDVIEGSISAFGELVVGSLACINTPRIVGRTVHTPHRGLERDLMKAQAITGRFPLRAWTTIHLHITPPDEAKGLPDYEAHLTGRKARHFVRAHFRIKNCKLEFVTAHWRGDASKGIKRSRYKVSKKRGRLN